ncbi:MAG TPA: hypothetical protein VNW47_08075 [Terriglobales bacterium]|jgi:hypothetical protein|nr:hypothetical protein [Terriglobales bacterium]
MKTRFAAVVLSFATLSVASGMAQTGAGNGNAIALAKKSPAVQTAYNYLISQAQTLQDDSLRSQTLDAISNPTTCVKHRVNVSPAMQQAIVQQLLAAGLADPNDNNTFPGGLLAGIYPPIVNDGGACPQLPQAFFSAPGSVFGGHHSYPGGLPIHESNNDTSDVFLANQYRAVYGHSAHGFPSLDPKVVDKKPGEKGEVFIDQDIIVGAPIWHDWGKSIVFQWNADGSEFPELNFGGNGVTDGLGGTAGNSKTGAHHIISVAEAMARGLSPAFVITQASAHSNPTSGNEYKVVNWIRAAAIMAQIDPVATGYLMLDAHGILRLPALRKLGDIDLADLGQTNVLAEYTLHNLSDADFTYSGPAVAAAQTILQDLASRYGYDPSNTSVYNNGFRNPVLSFLTGERILMLYSEQGLAGVQGEIDKLKKSHII